MAIKLSISNITASNSRDKFLKAIKSLSDAMRLDAEIDQGTFKKAGDKYEIKKSMATKTEKSFDGIPQLLFFPALSCFPVNNIIGENGIVNKKPEIVLTIMIDK